MDMEREKKMNRRAKDWCNSLEGSDKLRRDVMALFVPALSSQYGSGENMWTVEWSPRRRGDEKGSMVTGVTSGGGGSMKRAAEVEACARKRGRQEVEVEEEEEDKDEHSDALHSYASDSGIRTDNDSNYGDDGKHGEEEGYDYKETRHQHQPNSTRPSIYSRRTLQPPISPYPTTLPSPITTNSNKRLAPSHSRRTVKQVTFSDDPEEDSDNDVIEPRPRREVSPSKLGSLRDGFGRRRV